MMHNISRFFVENKDPNNFKKISPSKNPNLKIDGHQVEAGDFYEYMAYNKTISNPSPFCFNGYAPRFNFSRFSTTSFGDNLYILSLY